MIFRSHRLVLWPNTAICEFGPKIFRSCRLVLWPSVVKLWSGSKSSHYSWLSFWSITVNFIFRSNYLFKTAQQWAIQEPIRFRTITAPSDFWLDSAKKITVYRGVIRFFFFPAISTSFYSLTPSVCHTVFQYSWIQYVISGILVYVINYRRIQAVQKPISFWQLIKRPWERTYFFRQAGWPFRRTAVHAEPRRNQRFLWF